MVLLVWSGYGSPPCKSRPRPTGIFTSSLSVIAEKMELLWTANMAGRRIASGSNNSDDYLACILEILLDGFPILFRIRIELLEAKVECNL